MESTFACIELNAAGIDIGSFSHFVAVPQGRDTEVVREFEGLCVQINRTRSEEKKKPSEERISNFIARIAAQEETNELEPIDKTS